MGWLAFDDWVELMVVILSTVALFASMGYFYHNEVKEYGKTRYKHFWDFYFHYAEDEVMGMNIFILVLVIFNIVRVIYTALYGFDPLV